MDIYYLLDYFLFALFASFAVLQTALSKKASKRFYVGIIVLLLSYVWFFTSKDRNVPTIVEGAQLFLVFAVSAIFATASTKILVRINKKR